MPTEANRSEPFPLTSEPVSVAVNEYVAARRLGLSVDTLRRDRRLGQLGIPFVKYGSGKHGTVRYDLQDLDRFVEARKRRTLPPAPQPKPVVEEQPIAPEPEPRSLPQPVAPARPAASWSEPEAPTTRSRSPWSDPLPPTEADVFDDDVFEDPFATGRSGPRRRGPGGYFSGR